MKIKQVYDDEGMSFDRYFIIFEEDGVTEGLGLGVSNNPESPQGLSIFSVFVEGSHLGKKIPFKQLPKNVQEHILTRMRKK
jgi:hypothetical protein